MSSASDRTLFCYSVKANSNLSLLKIIASHGMGFDIVSKGELHRAIKAGVNTKKIVYSGVGKTKEEISYALNNNILCFKNGKTLENGTNRLKNSMRKNKIEITVDLNHGNHKQSIYFCDLSYDYVRINSEYTT